MRSIAKISLITLLGLSLSLVACGKKPAQETSAQTAPETQVKTEAQETQAQERVENEAQTEQTQEQQKSQETQAKEAEKQEARKIVVGVMAGPETEVMQTAAKIAKEKYNLEVELIEFNDYVAPNAALDDKSIDANAIQHKPYLDQTIAAKNYEFEIAGNTLVYPMGVFSLKYATLAEIPAKSKIAIPNDPSNGARALILLHDTGLLKLKDRNNLNATVNDIAENSKKFEFVELDASMLPRALQDVAAAVINNTFSGPETMPKNYKQILLESDESPYVNIIVVRRGDEDKQEVQDLVAAFQSDEVLAKAKTLFTSVVAGWK